jgi:hypothetical protein
MTQQTMNGQIWLSRDGKTEGPFEQADIDKLRSNGAISNYTWIWTPESKAWSPIHMAPPPPPAPQATQAPAVTAPSPAPAAAAPTPTATPTPSPTPTASASASTSTSSPTLTKTVIPTKTAIPVAASGPPAMAAGPAVRSAVRPLAAICHDNRSVVAGMLEAKLGEIWILSSKDRLTEIPPFRKGAKVWINLLDEQSGQSENAQATLVDYKKTSQAWEYSLKWQTQNPRLVT